MSEHTVRASGRHAELAASDSGFETGRGASARLDYDMRNCLDGNVAAGPLAELFRVDLTAATGQCDHWGSVGHLGEAVVFGDSPGLVVRCRACEGVLLKLVESPDRLWLDVRGLTYLEIARPE